MTKEEKICFRLGQNASAAALPFAPCYDRNMDSMVSENRSECGLNRNSQNMSAWYMGYLRQYVLDGKLLNADMFQTAMIGMFPSAKEGAIQPWLQFLEDIAGNGQHVDFQEEPDPETAAAHWYDTLLAGFYGLKAKHGEAAAARTLELGLEGLCLYPYELEEATVQLGQGAGFEKLGQLMRDGLLESGTAEFPKLRDVPAEDIPSQSPQMNLNF